MSSGRGKLGLIFGLGIAALTLLPLWFFLIGPQLRHDRLVEKGVRAPGRILSVEESGTVVNDVPELELQIEFTRKDGVLDTAMTDFVPARLDLYKFVPGVGVTAAYDVEDPEELTIVELLGPATQFPTADIPGVNVDSIRRVADSLTNEVNKLKAR